MQTGELSPHAERLHLGAVAPAGRHVVHVEERFIHPAIEGKITTLSNSVVDAAMEASSNGDVKGAFEILTQATKESPDDSETIIAFWETACELRRPMEAVPAMYRLAKSALRKGEIELAAQYWGDVVERVPIELPPSDRNRDYLKTKKVKMGHLLKSV